MSSPEFNYEKSDLFFKFNKGWCVVSLEDQLKREDYITEKEVTCFAQNANHAAIVYKDLQNTIFVYNLKSDKITYIRPYDSKIIKVKLVDKFLIIIFEKRIFICDLMGVTIVRDIHTGSCNPKGIIALTKEINNLFLAYPVSDDSGRVAVFDLSIHRAVSVLQAHESRLVSLAFSSDSKLLATASVRSAVIRVFIWSTEEQVAFFRRGYDVQVYYIDAYLPIGNALSQLKSACAPKEDTVICNSDHDETTEGYETFVERPSYKDFWWVTTEGTGSDAPSGQLEESNIQPLSPSIRNDLSSLDEFITSIEHSADESPLEDLSSFHDTLASVKDYDEELHLEGLNSFGDSPTSTQHSAKELRPASSIEKEDSISNDSLEGVSSFHESPVCMEESEEALQMPDSGKEKTLTISNDRKQDDSSENDENIEVISPSKELSDGNEWEAVGKDSFSSGDFVEDFILFTPPR
ncbi:hypothetical protein Aperf_G00000120959 [Anoplocephala perfoliata]